MTLEKLLNKKEIYPEDLFQLEESELSLSKMQPYLEELQNKGICFDFSEVKDQDKEYIAIDCDQFVKFILKSKYDREKEIELLIHELCDKAENQEAIDWLDRVYRFHLYENEYNKSEIEHIIDWMNSFRDENKSIISLKLTYPDSIKRSLKWTEELNKKSVLSPGKIQVIMSFNDGSYICRLLDKEARAWEGYHMSHCVASDQYENHSGLYSLRDSTHHPHLTIELKGSSIDQIRGKGNGSVHPNYIDSVINFLSSLNITIDKGEMKNLGYLFISEDTKDELANLFHGEKKFFSLKDQNFIYDKSRLNLKSKLNLKPLSDETFLVAARVASYDDLEFLVTNKLVNINAKYCQALKTAAIKNRLDLVKLFVKHGADIHFDNDWILRGASQNGHIEIAKFLLDNGAHVSAMNDYALRNAANNGNLEVVRLLIEKGANIHALNDEALHLAADHGWIEVVKLLIENGSDIHSQGDLALRWAAYNGHLTTVQYLVEKGANIHAVFDDVFGSAARGRHLDVVNFIYNLKPEYCDKKFPAFVKKLVKP